MARVNEQSERAELILAAVNSVGEIGENATQYEFEKRVADRALMIRRCVQKNSFTDKLLNSVVLIARIDGVEHEESSNRDVITFTAANEDGKSETVRTQRLESSNGREVSNAARSCVGSNAAIYKYNEPRSDKSGQTVRIALKIVPLSR